MKQDNIIQEKQEFILAITRFSTYLFNKIKKILKKHSTSPKIQELVFNYALTCQFKSIHAFFSFFFIHTIQHDQNFFFFFFYSKLKSRKIEDEDDKHNFSLMCSVKIKKLSKVIFLYRV